ncbi:MAG: cupin domain-containing protein [Candidatus Omnitrophica bacterium]|nr:cupin domain-containing protein [Candidatus Omnitrophota bacterium]
MNLADKIAKLIKESECRSLTNLHKVIADLFEDQAITYKTLLRTVHGKSQIRENSLFQIATALGMKTSSLREGTNTQAQEEKDIPGTYLYNDKASLLKLNHRLPFSPNRITIKPGGQTTKEQDPASKGAFIKWVYVLSGKVELTIEGKLNLEKKPLKREDHYCFDSTQPHYFENRASRTATLLVICHGSTATA